MVSPSLLELKILLVDDDAWNVAYVYEILSAYGYTNIESVTDPRTVLEVVTASPPDIVLLDIHMPHLDGFALLELLRGTLDPELYLPILVVTSDADSETRNRALRAGATDFLPKPFEEIVVVARVAHLLQARSMQLQLSRFQTQYAELPIPTNTAAPALTDSQRLRALLRNIPTGILMEDRTGKITLANGELCRVLGIPGHPNRLLGKDREAFMEQVSSQFANSVVFARRSREILIAGVPVSHERLVLSNSRVLERDYIPLEEEERGRGHLWLYREVTQG